MNSVFVVDENERCVGMKKILVALGFVSFGLGVLGVFLPVLPTTPFMLLAAFLFMHGSQRCYDWLLNHPRYGERVRDFQVDRALPLRVKVWSLVTMWVTMLSSVFVFLGDYRYVQVFLMLVAVGVTVHILSFKTKR